MNLGASRVFLAAILFVAIPAQAETAEEIAGSYTVVQIKAKVCRSTYELGSLRADSGEVSAADAYREYISCRMDASKDAKKIYSKLLPKLKSAEAKRDLKEYQVALMSLIEGGEPKSQERAIDFQRRIAELEGKVESAWARLSLNF